MNIDQFIDFAINTLPSLAVKIFAVLILIMHALFSIILVRQVKLMTRVVEVKISPFIYTLALIHLLASVLILLWTIVFL